MGGGGGEGLGDWIEDGREHDRKDVGRALRGWRETRIRLAASRSIQGNKNKSEENVGRPACRRDHEEDDPTVRCRLSNFLQCGFARRGGSERREDEPPARSRRNSRLKRQEAAKVEGREGTEIGGERRGDGGERRERETR